MRHFSNPFNQYKVVAAGVVIFLLVSPTAAFAFDPNPLHWVGQGIQGVLSAITTAGFIAIVAWLGKGRWDAMVLKKAVYDIKGAVDEFRLATLQGSPGGTKVVADEWGKVAGKTLTGILGILRGINPAWIPHL